MSKQNPSTARRIGAAGFTLIEMLAVIVLIGRPAKPSCNR